jgi:hypothetical protein
VLMTCPACAFQPQHVGLGLRPFVLFADRHLE